MFEAGLRKAWILAAGDDAVIRMRWEVVNLMSLSNPNTV